FDIADTDGSAAAWAKLLRGTQALAAAAPGGDPPERVAAMVALPLGIEAPRELAAAEGQDPRRVRDRVFSAVRALVEGASRQRPLVLVIEDIHWADEGMLDLIEYLGRWARGPLLIVCLARDELLERRPGWGGGRRNATTIALEPLPERDALELVAALLRAAMTARRGGSPSRWRCARAATRCSRRRW